MVELNKLKTQLFNNFFFFNMCNLHQNICYRIFESQNFNKKSINIFT
jgi:hypothetical protein